MLSESVELAVNMTNERDTLIIVTSHHASSVTFSGFVDRGADPLGMF